MNDQPKREGVTIDAEPITPGRRQDVVARHEQPPANPFDVDPQHFARQIQQRGENYSALVGWLVDNMVEGEDVVQVHFVKRSQCSFDGPPPRGSCGPTLEPGHWSDPDLSKKGAEKVCGLLGLGTRFLGMEDFRHAALKGVKIEHVIIDCELYNERATLSQGTGACSLSETTGDLNNAMKKAAKRAHVDAVKRCAGLSGLATVIKQRMPPPDPEAAARRAEAARRRPPARGGASSRWSTGAKLDVCPIGKHQNRPWREIPTDYLEWALKEWADKPDLVSAVAGELSRRQGATGSGSTRTRPPPDVHPNAPEFPDDEIPY